RKLTLIAKDVKLWKIEIPGNHDDELANFPLQDLYASFHPQNW
ncbi:18515_t:CDS:1, partial [Rhizophagus irregularis]